MEKALIARRVVVFGRVQGVWFRANTQHIARTFELTGWVRNREDGSVEAVFEGTAQAVAAAVRWCEQGPERAVVERTEVHEQAPEAFSDFSIRD